MSVLRPWRAGTGDASSCSTFEAQTTAARWERVDVYAESTAWITGRPGLRLGTH